MSKNNKPSWLAEVTDITKDVNVEAFSPNDFQPNFQTPKNIIAVAKRNVATKKVAYALRLDEEINEVLINETLGSKNAVINLLLKYAIADIKKKGIPLND